MKKIEINGRDVTIDQVWEVAYSPVKVRFELAADARKKMAESRAYIEGKMHGGDPIYGVNTGFGAFSSVQHF